MEDFNGIISLLIACVELLLFVNLLFFSKKNKENKIAITIIALLFFYQIMEFMICYIGLNYQFVIYSAFAGITFLPPLTLYFILVFIKNESKWNKLIFLPAFLFVVYYLIVIEKFAVTHCTVLYAMYSYPLGDLYGVFYYLPILITIVLLAKSSKKENEVKRKVLKKILLYGYLLTFLPALILVLFIPDLVNAAESILCKFAFILAVALTLFVLKNKNIEPGV